MGDRNPSTIENDLKKTREEMTQTVDQLVSSLSPKQNAKRVKANALDKAHQALGQAQDLLEQAKSGDRKAQKILAGIAAGVGLAGTLLIRKVLR